MRILVVGSGTAGLISALILKEFLNCEISIVSSSSIGTVGVGEGSTEHFNEFMEFVGIDQYSLIKECGATFKTGIMFSNWSEKDYMHSVWNPFSDIYGQYAYVYANCIINNKNLTPRYLWENKLPLWFLNKEDEKFSNQYHFDTNKLNTFLVNLCKNRKINFFDDEIKNVILDSSGKILKLIGNNKEYLYDFYIDSSGFRRELIGKMGAKWVSFKKYLKMNSAVVFPTEDENEYNIWTLSKAMKYGWRFKIPTYGRHGNGYIYDESYTSLDDIKNELDKEFSTDIQISKKFSFDPGYLEEVWIKNCVAIGLSGSFVEPLEATSIGTSIQQSFLLMHKINNYSEKDIKLYNKDFKSIMENIRDFIFLHYIVDKNDSNFWKDIKTVDAPETLKEKLSLWENRLPIKEDFRNDSNYCLFSFLNYIVVMDGIGMINKNKISSDFFNLNSEKVKESYQKIYNFDFFEKNAKFISHKKMIELTNLL